MMMDADGAAVEEATGFEVATGFLIVAGAVCVGFAVTTGAVVVAGGGGSAVATVDAVSDGVGAIAATGGEG